MRARGSHVLMDQEMSGEKWQLGLRHMLDVYSQICGRSEPTVGGSLSFSVMFLQKRCHRSSGLLDILIPMYFRYYCCAILFFYSSL